MQLSKLFKRKPPDACLLTSSSFVSQGISLLSILILTKELASVETFGRFSAFLSVTAIVSSVSLLSLEKAIPNKQDDDLSHFAVQLIYILTVFCTISICIFYMFRFSFAEAATIQIFSNGIINLATHTNVRGKRIKSLSLGRILPNAIFFLYTAWFLKTGAEIGLNSLVNTYTASFTIAAVLYAIISFNNLKLRIQDLKISIIDTLISERKFISAFSASKLLNSASYQLPVIIIERFLSPAASAQYSLALRLGLGPVNLIGNAFSQIFHGQIAERQRNNEEIYPIFKGTSKSTFKYGLIAILLTALIIPTFITYIYGSQYDTTIAIILILSPLFYAIIAVAPLTSMLMVRREHKIEITNQLSFFLISILSFAIAAIYSDLVTGTVIFMILSCLRYSYIFYKLKQIVLLADTQRS